MTVSKKEQMLRKVRGLLAKAEDPACTPEEAEAFSAKAEQLIAAYAIDLALLAEKKGDRSKPVMITLDTEKNYRAPFVSLLTGIADAFGCKPVLAGGTMTTAKKLHLVGYEADLDMVQTLYGSLMLQATTAVLAGAKASGTRGDDLWRFKQSFLVGFAAKVGQRLAETYKRTVEEAKPGAALVLRDRRSEVEDKFGELFPDTKKVNGPSAHDRAGYAGGVQAGSRADIGHGRVGSRKQIAS
ncbi:MAG TPA: DUF2786 domain-containing protein [Spirillospora sp.]|nr:DUF2786 domain-containing protein [Spirillospora sp.]